MCCYLVVVYHAQPIINRADNQKIKGDDSDCPPIGVSHLGYRAAVLGAVMQLLRITMDYYTLQNIPDWNCRT